MSAEARLFRSLLRTDFMLFVERCFTTVNPGLAFRDSWHLHAIAEALRGVDEGWRRRLIVNVPPRSGKSILLSIAYPAWRLGHDPRTRIICVSSDDKLVASLAGSFRAVIESTWYRRAFPTFAVKRGGNRATETITTGRGYRYGVSLGGSVLGRGADLIIADDAMSPAAALSEPVRRRELEIWTTKFPSRLDDKSKGAIIIVGQRLHQDDLVGFLTGVQGGPMIKKREWDMLIIPAVAPQAQDYRIGPGVREVHRRQEGEVLLPDREPGEVLDRLKVEMGSMNFSAQYMQDPVPPGGNIIRRDWLRFYDYEPPEFLRTLSSWDLASTIAERSSYSVGLLWGELDRIYYLLDIVRGKYETPTLRKLIIAHEEAWDPVETVIEKTELGESICQDLWRTTKLRPKLMSARIDKEARLLTQAARFEAGRVLLPRRAPWLADYVNELLAFPYGRHDDQVDATSQALHVLTGRASLKTPSVRVRSF